MENKQFCQSCSMPLDAMEVKGTEKDGSKSGEYCRYCYIDGVFTNPSMTLEEMRELVKMQMEKMKIEDTIVEQAIKLLPELKRWRLRTPAL